MTTKREALAAMLEGSKVRIAVEIRPGVVLPEHVLAMPVALIDLSWRFPHRMSLDEDAVRARLRFGAEYFDCVIPWPAVLGAYRWADESTADWPSDAMTAIAPVVNDPPAKLVAVAGGGEESDAERMHPMPRPRLRLVRSDE